MRVWMHTSLDEVHSVLFWFVCSLPKITLLSTPFNIIQENFFFYKNTHDIMSVFHLIQAVKQIFD